ncbi:Lactonase, 7-bladed beta-propeller-domain-containing protein [Blyttiomyces helicus]|uniref:Lactonase, 7-bladed beta-propeller-domain-containing protein n=1 Tax=Blyttiomyces helicus TaxID=388810 RepID=A0A4P9W8L7_9FUNG|nr:Lactonase, 7-bladed beta-propeller-domain-containing protein [Blyttiomyces helicus]|eukprot:RKO87803.1 Lactonase, 7-bladed beta-propeller-domain-containing protein [Blyttiomyces helicus]
MTTATPTDRDRFIFVGTGGSKILTLKFNPTTGTLTPTQTQTPSPTPSFLALHPNLPLLFAGNEVSPGTVTSFAVSCEDGTLTRVDATESGGDGPAHVAVHPEGGSVAAANYGGGSVGVVSVREDGTFVRGSLTRFKYSGSGPDKSRQESPHPHGVYFHPTQPLLLVPDLGTDQIHAHPLSFGSIAPPLLDLVVHRPGGAGPRHLAFHPSLPIAYLVDEMLNTVSALTNDPASGALTFTQSWSLLPDGAARGFDITAAEIALSKDGRFLYVSQRGHELVVVFQVSPADGSLELVQCLKLGGRQPRHFVLADAWMLVALQGSRAIQVLRVLEDGSLEAATILEGLEEEPQCLVLL